MTTRAQIRPLLAAVVVCLPVAGCGDDDVGDPIPAAKATQLESQLDSVRNDVDQDLCDDAATAVEDARATVDTLDDDGVGSDVQDALGDGVDNLGSLVSQECEEEVETVPETTPETIPETIPEPTTPEPTTPEPTTPEPTTPGPEPEPDEDSGGVQFDPNTDLPPGQEKKEEDDD